MVFWFVYALLFLFAAWFLVVSMIAYRRSGRRSAKGAAWARQPAGSVPSSLDMEKHLIALEAQAIVAPSIALREARELYTDVYKRRPADAVHFEDILLTLDLKASERRRRVRS